MTRRRHSGPGAHVQHGRFFTALFFAAALFPIHVQQANAQRPPPLESQDGLSWWPVRENVWMLIGAGANIGVSIGPDGVLLVNTGEARAGDRILAAIKELETELNAFGLLDRGGSAGGRAETRSRLPANLYAPPKPIRYIVNTGPQAHNTGGNPLLATAGAARSGGDTAGMTADAPGNATILAHENVLVRLTDSNASFDALPTETYFVPEHRLSAFFNGEGVRLIHVPHATTDGDSIVYFRGSDVIATGDLFSMETFPAIDIDRGGHINGVLDGLNLILKLAIPEFRAEGGTMIVPGRGRLADAADVGYYRDMLTIIRDQIQHHIDRGLTLEQVIEERPTYGYEGRFGSEDGPWTTEMFIEAVYRSLDQRQD